MLIDTKHLGRMILVGLSWLTAGTALSADLIMTAPPRGSVQEESALYQPLARYLSKLTGENVIYQHPQTWQQYESDMRRDKYDIILDDAHFIAWRIMHLNNDVLIRLPDSLEYYLLVAKVDTVLLKIDDLVGQKVCAHAAPDLSALFVLAQFRNPVRQPLIHNVDGDMSQIHATFTRGECQAMVVRRDYYESQLDVAQRDNLRPLLKSQPIPNLGLSVSQRVSARAKNQILTSLVLGKGVKYTKPLIQRFGHAGMRSFMPAKNRDYAGQNMFLEGVVFGWQRPPR